MSRGAKFTKQKLGHPWWHRFFIKWKMAGTWRFPVDEYWCTKCRKIVRVGYLSKFNINQVDDFPLEVSK